MICNALWYFPFNSFLFQVQILIFCCSVTQLCLTLCDPMDCSTPGFPVLTISRSLLKLMSIESVMPSNHLILCCPLLLLPSIFPSIRIFFSELVLYNRLPKYWSFSFNISSSNEYSLGSTHYGLLNCLMFSPNGCNHGLRSTILVACSFYSLLETLGFQRENSKAQWTM